MAREKQTYEYVMDVALRATLKEHGFKRKTYATYIRETEDRVWIFELEAHPRLGVGFSEMAGVRVPELDRIFERYAPKKRARQGATRNPSHTVASCLELMEIAAGHDYDTTRITRASKIWSKKYEAARKHPVMKYRRYGWWWLLASLPLSEEGEEGRERYDRRMDELIVEFGQYFNETWLQYALLWYRRCDDPLFIADWMATREHAGMHYCTLAVLHHLGGDGTGAANYLQRCFDDAAVSYDQLHHKLYKEYHRSLLQRWCGNKGWSDEEIGDMTRVRLNERKWNAVAARNLADGLGIAV